MTLDLSFGKNRSDKNWKAEYLDWQELVERLRKVRRTNETMAEYDQMDNFSKGRIKDGPALVGGLVKSGRRKKENITSRSLITLDADAATADFFLDTELAIGGVAYVIYSTHSHRANHLRYRLIIPLDRAVGIDEYAAISRKVASNIGLHHFDKTTFQAQRLMYLPSCSKDAQPVFIEGEGVLLNADQVLAEYADWTDIASWPRHKDASAAIALKKAQDPHMKRGTIGLFCRTFPIDAAIEIFLGEQYDRGTMPHRYTYRGGSSANGLEIYPEQDLAYSHQDSDPIADGRTYNAFDLVRIHRFSHLDEDWVEGTKTPPPSVVAMELWASRLDEVKKTAVEEKQTEYAELLDAKSDSILDDEDWETRLALHHKTGEVLSTAANVELILTHGAFRNVLAYDAFRNAEVIRDDLPWRKRKRPRQEYEPWDGSDDARLRHWFKLTHNINGQGLIMDAFKEVACGNEFHPIKEHIESVAWDGIPRVDTLFIDYLGAENSAYTREVTAKMLLAAVTRIYEPGTKFDEMLVLVGAQGTHKSSLLAKLGGRWFSDSLRNFDNKEAGEHLQNGWIFEIGELSAMKNAELEEVKAFLSKTEDRYRVAYDRAVSDFPRKCVFFGTTNTVDFLRDKTGNRRFWPVAVSRENAKYSHWEHLTEAGVKQIWAEVLCRYKGGESLQLSEAAAKEALAHQTRHEEEDSREGLIYAWLEEQEEDFDGELIPRNRVCAVQIWVECLNGDRGKFPRWEAADIRNLMRKHPDWRELDKRQRTDGYGLQTVFVRKKR